MRGTVRVCEKDCQFPISYLIPLNCSPTAFPSVYSTAANLAENPHLVLPTGSIDDIKESMEQLSGLRDIDFLEKLQLKFKVPLLIYIVSASEKEEPNWVSEYLGPQQI